MDIKLVLPALLVITSLGCSEPTATEQLASSKQASEYLTEDVLISTRDGAQISAVVMRSAKVPEPAPAILQFTIYVRDQGRDLDTLKAAVDRGYIGVFAYTRGKRHSPDEIVPYEHDGSDAYDVIDWISKQSWSDGRVGMQGGSYNGFTQWAATKKLHPALKTIVPIVASRPGMGLPMENNIFINPNYQWTFYVTNNKTLDNEVNSDNARFRDMQFKWWDSGRAYREIDQIDGQDNPWLQRWLAHPGYDNYWQAMAPYNQEFAQIDIPVLSIDGYYNDSQNSGLYYFREHLRWNPGAEHYLVIGPYGHFGAQRGGQKTLNGIEVDPVALFDIEQLTFDWFDYVFRAGTLPAMLKDNINYQTIGTSQWFGADSLDSMITRSKRLYFSTEKSPIDGTYQLLESQPEEKASLSQVIDLADRQLWYNDYYPNPIIKDAIDTSSGYIFVSEPLAEPAVYNGAFSGEFSITVNKRDVDLGLSLYELMPSGEYFQLSYYVGRASYAKDITRRQLLTPSDTEAVPFNNTRLVSKKLAKDSRIVAYINVNKNPFSQLNYGSGNDVSDETVDSSGEPLRIQWHNQSFVDIPLKH